MPLKGALLHGAPAREFTGIFMGESTDTPDPVENERQILPD
jgi:hypothetical protein